MPGELVPLLDRVFPAVGELLDPFMQTLAQGFLAELDADSTTMIAK